MASDSQGKSISSSRSVSMFDLEPNPFEQSFASTKKSHSVAAIGVSGQQPPDSKTRPTQGLLSERNSTLSISEITSNSHIAGTNDQKKPYPFFYGGQKPTLTSPPLLTPGGSKRLPPIIFSPSFIQQAPGEPSMIDQGHATALANVSPKNNRSNATEAQRPPLTISLSRTGLIPNESSLRTGLTPNILTPGHQLPPTHYPYHPLSYYHGSKGDVGSHDEMKSNNGISVGLGVPNSNELGQNSQALTPGLGSLLAFSPTSTIPKNTGSGPKNDPSQADPNVQGKSVLQDPVAESIIPASGYKQRKPSLVNSPPRSTARKKRRASVNSKGSKPPKSNRTSTSNDSKMTKIDTGDKESDDEQERKRREFLERNRVAASKFRQRKKEYIKKVEMDLKFYESEYDDMSRAMNKMCGMSQGSSSPSSSLISMLETAITKNDVASSLSILTHIKQVLYDTKYVQRKGRNPRLGIECPQESEEEEKQRIDKDRSLSRSRNGSLAGIPSSSNSNQSPNNHTAGPMAASFIPSGAPNSLGTNSNTSSLGIEHVSLGSESTPDLSTVKVEDAAVTSMTPTFNEKNQSTGPPVASAIGTISSLPDVINGRPVIPLNGIEPRLDSSSNLASEIRHSSLVNLASTVASTGSMASQYPNSN